MNFIPWESLIQKMVEDLKRTRPASHSVVILNWRKILADEPNSLKPFQIDQVVREVHKRIQINAGRS